MNAMGKWDESCGDYSRGAANLRENLTRSALAVTRVAVEIGFFDIHA
jgi:hypothetical protein